MKKIKVLFFSVMIIAFSNSVYGVMAYPYPVEITQPDGTKITIILKGDEHVKWAETVDGYSILRNSRGIYEYAIRNSKEDLVPSGIPVRNQAERSSSEIQLLNQTDKGLTYSKSQAGLMKSISGMNEPSPGRVFPTTGSRKLVCILMGFTDVAFTKAKADFENLFNQVGYNADGATGSVYDFYKENSYNQLDLTITVAGPFTAANNMAFYGANNATTGSDLKPRELITEAVLLADPTVNYADFDNDNDGTVDGVYVIYAGYGEEYTGVSTDAIWAHAWSITPLILDGKTVSKYSCSAELRGGNGTGLTRIGVICHEFGHVMGASDYYDTDYTTNGSYSGTGNWDLMAGGSWNNSGVTPAQHNPYTKVYSYGWATATTLTSGTSVNITLNDAELNRDSFYRVNSVTPNEFFLIENRQQHKFDTNIPGHGMIIYHVDGNYISATGNRINAGSHQGLYPVCASATGNPPATYGSINSAGLPFPGTGIKTSFTDVTTPSSKCWAGANMNKPITGITENATTKTVSFSFVVNTTAPTAITLPASGILPTSGTLNAQVSASNSPATITFEYGTTTSYGTSVNGTPNTVSGETLTNISAVLTGLTSNTTYNFRVKAVNSVGTTYGSNMTFNPVILSLPVTENFATSTMPDGWATQNTGAGITERWSISNSASAGGAAYELKCSYQNNGPWPGTTRVITPAINTVGESGIALSFKHMFDDYATGATIRIQSSKDKVTWTNEAWSLTSGSGNIGPAIVNTTISNNLNSPNTYIAFVITGDLFSFDYWYIDNVSITTAKPSITTTAVSAVSSTEALCGGNVTSDGGFSVTQRGVCWGTTANPTIELSTKTTDGTGTGTFTSNITRLTPGVVYHVRAYAINSSGTSYGSDIRFSLGTVVIPTVNTTEVSEITSTTAISGGMVTFDGCANIIAKGICWSTLPYPTIALSTKTTEGSGLDSYTSELSELSPGTTYYVRAYSTNSAGTGYGAQAIFSTSPAIYTMDNDPVKTCNGIFTDSGGKLGDYSINEDFTKVFTPLTLVNKMSFTFDSFVTETTYDYLYIYDGPNILSPPFAGSPFTGTQTIGTITASSQNTTGAITFRFHSDGSINRAGWVAEASCILVAVPPSITTNPVSSITSTTAISGGDIADIGGADVTERGVCWSTAVNPTIGLSTKTTVGPGNDTFTSSITGLTPGTAYHLRAYATNSAGTGYGEDIQFTTITIPTLTTIQVSAITLITASSGGNITSDGGDAVIARGICWSTSANPTVALSTKSTDGTGDGSFISEITGLSPGVIYHIRAYATNNAGTGYGTDIQFTTCTVVVVPTLTTTALTEITLASAISGGTITSTGCATVTARGVCWGTSANPTIALTTKTSDGTGAGSFNSNISGLAPGVVYHVRAYATNSAGTGYGTDIPFTTCTVVVSPTLSTTAVTGITSTSAKSGGSITSSGCATVNSRGVCWSTAVNPTIALITKTTDGTGEGLYSSNITDLTGGTTYHIRAYSTNISGTAYGDDILFTTAPPSPLAVAATNIAQTSFTANWGSSATAAGYHLDVSTNINFSTFVSGYSDKDIGNLTSTNVAGLIANTNYYYRVRAYSTSGTGTNSNSITTTTLPDPPSVPLANSATNILQTGFTANWSSSAMAAGYRLDISVSSVFSTFIADYNNKDMGSLTNTSVTGLSASTTYYYRVRAYNIVGTSTNSNIISTRTLINPPPAPVVNAATNIVQTSFMANWSSSSTASGYRLDVSTNNEFTSFVSGYNNRNIGNQLNTSVSGLAASTSYYYRVRAYNAGGTSPNSETRVITTLINTPVSPTAGSATNILQTSFTANWSSSPAATGYRLDVSTNTGFTSFVSGYNNKDIGNLNSSSVMGLTAKTTYYYRVKAYNVGGTGSSSNIINVTTLTVPPSVPSGLTVSSCNNLVTLKWRKNTDPYFSRYRIYGGTTNNPTTKIDSSSGNISDTLKIISGLINGRTYYFRVTAVNYDGPESPFSSQVNTIVKTGVIPKIKKKWDNVLICYNLGDSITSYQWYNGSSSISNATGQYYVINTIPGIYQVKTIDKNGCLNSSNAIPGSGTKSLSVYPNPASVSFSLKLNDDSEGGAVVRILNSAGIKVMEVRTENIHNELLKVIPVNNLDEGIYIVEVLLDNKDLYYSKIVVIK